MFRFTKVTQFCVATAFLMAICPSLAADTPLPQNIQKCYEMAEVDSQTLECMDMEKSYWEIARTGAWAEAMERCAQMGEQRESFNPNFTNKCKDDLTKAKRAWNDYYMAMTSLYCSPNAVGDDEIMCKGLRLQLVKEQFNILNQYFYKFEQ